ncbi:hypothetical protein V8C26DRAFT_383583 [Trichoderma gracile]
MTTFFRPAAILNGWPLNKRCSCWVAFALAWHIVIAMAAVFPLSGSAPCPPSKETQSSQSRKMSIRVLVLHSQWQLLSFAHPCLWGGNNEKKQGVTRHLRSELCVLWPTYLLLMGLWTTHTHTHTHAYQHKQLPGKLQMMQSC